MQFFTFTAYLQKYLTYVNIRLKRKVFSYPLRDVLPTLYVHWRSTFFP